MDKYRKVLVAYDGSRASRNALFQAFRLAPWVKVVAVVPDFRGELDLTAVDSPKEVILGPGKKLLAEAQKIARQAERTILTDLEQGEPYDRIVSVAREENCDCIVMGNKGQHSLERELMGGVTARVIGHTTKDVLVVRETGDLAWNSILLATDGSAHSAAAAERAMELALHHGARLTMVSVVYVNDEFLALAPRAVAEMVAKAEAKLEELKRQAAAQGIEARTEVREGDPHLGIAEAAARCQADCIVMGSHGRRGLSRLLMGSVTERVIGFTQCPVLVRHLQ